MCKICYESSNPMAMKSILHPTEERWNKLMVEAEALLKQLKAKANENLRQPLERA